MFIKKNTCNIFYKIKNSAEKNLKELCEWWDIYEKQHFFVNAIGVYDRLFWERQFAEDKSEEEPFYYKIMDRSYPVFINIFYDEGFQKLPGIVLKPLDAETLNLYSKILYSCGIIGWMQSLIDDVNAGYTTYYSIGKYIRIRFNHKYHWNEYLDKEYISWYSKYVTEFQRAKYDELSKIQDKIIHKMESSVFVWKENFMGYSNDEEIEYYFNKHALLDAQQATEWDMFPPDSKFGGLFYGNIIQSVVDFSGYSIKHLNYAILLKAKHPELLLENLLPNIIIEQDILKLLQSNLSADMEEAQRILDLLSLSYNNKLYYANTKAACAPLIKISETQYVRSSCGFLDRPFEFVLHNVKNTYPKDWSRNAGEREGVFRKQIYAFFSSDNFQCLNQSVIIKDENGHVITDIDSVVIDKSRKQIALFQLKWQDHTDDSAFSLKSKSDNYNHKTQKWLLDVHNWISSNDQEKIARALNIKKQYVEKSGIYIFVVGRRHGNYSGNIKPAEDCAWAQWYQLMQICMYLHQNNTFSIEEIFRYISLSNPTKRKILEEKTVFHYGKYRIHMGGAF